MAKSKKYRLIVVGLDKFFIEDLIELIAVKYSSICITLDYFPEIKDHLCHSLAPDAVLIQSGHPDHHLLEEFTRSHSLDLMIVSYSPQDFLGKLGALFDALDKWFTAIPYLPVHSNLAGFVGYTPVDLYIKQQGTLKKIIQKDSFLSEVGIKSHLGDNEGFFFIQREDRITYESELDDAKIAYFKADTVTSIQKNGPLGLIIPVLEEYAYYGIPESDSYILYSTLERMAYFFQESPELAGHVEKILSKNRYQLEHTAFLMSMNIASLSAMKIGSAVVYFNIVLASMVHDLGSLDYGFEEYEFNDWAMERMLEESVISSYTRHAETSLRELVKYRVCPRWVAEMILSHHENDSGFGYPLGIHSSSLGLATFIFSYNHEWAEKIYGAIAKGKGGIDLEFFISQMPSNSVRGKELKKIILNYLSSSSR